MNPKTLLHRVGRVLDPKRDITVTAPRPMLLAKNFVEYVFRITGFFIVLCLIAGMTLAACPDNILVASMPFILGILFCFYIALTTLGIPVFFMISEIENIRTRRFLGYLTIIAMLIATIYTFIESPIFELLLTYVGKLFPEAFTCANAVLLLDF